MYIFTLFYVLFNEFEDELDTLILYYVKFWLNFFLRFNFCVLFNLSFEAYLFKSNLLSISDIFYSNFLLYALRSLYDIRKDFLSSYKVSLGLKLWFDLKHLRILLIFVLNCLISYLNYIYVLISLKLGNNKYLIYKFWLNPKYLI